MVYANLEDNIFPEMFNDRSEGVLNWINENRDKYDWAKDPNAFEMTNLFLLGAKYSNEGYDINIQTLQDMWDIRSKDFANAGVSNKSFVYKICEDSFISAKTGKTLVNDEASHHALRKMAGIGLYLSQQKRDQKPIEYNNPQELLGLLQASRTLKGVHPELYDRYKFEDNLKKMVELQPENPFSKHIDNAMNELTSSTEKDNNSENNNELDEIDVN